MSLAKTWTLEFPRVQTQTRHKTTTMTSLSQWRDRSILMMWQLFNLISHKSKSPTQVYASMGEPVSQERLQCQAMCPQTHHPPTWSHNQQGTKHHQSTKKSAPRLNRSLKSSSSRSTPRKNFLIDLLPKLALLFRQLGLANGWRKELLDFSSRVSVRKTRASLSIKVEKEVAFGKLKLWGLTLC